VAELSDIAIKGFVRNLRASFKENILLTHRGLSGPGIVQISFYWNAVETLSINLFVELEPIPLFDCTTRRTAQHLT
jgi:hypothetical protein